MKILDRVLDFQVEPIQNIIKNSEQAEAGNIVFYGDSLFQSYDVNTYFKDSKIYNCGVSGATSELLLHLHEEAIGKYQPHTVFLLIGTNDLSDRYQYTHIDIAMKVYQLIEIIIQKYAVEKVYIISPLPIVEEKKAESMRDNKQLRILGESLASLCKEFESVFYIDVYDQFMEHGQLRLELTGDGLHLNAKGYEVLTSRLQPYVKNKNN